MPVDPVATRRFIESLSMQLEDHLASWKSGLVDAKRDIENTLNAMSDRIPAQAKGLFPEDLIAVMIEDAMPPPEIAAPVEKIVERIVERVVHVQAAAAVPAPPDWSLVRGALAAIESARTQVDVLTRFLGQANAHASRVALLVLRNDRLTGWKAIGYDASGGRDEAIKSIDIGVQDDPFAGEALRRERSLVAEPPDENSPLRRALGGRTPSRTLLVPMVIRDRLAGILCADELPGDEGRLNESALEILTFVTGLTVDLLAARKKIPSPTLTPMGEEIARFTSVVAEPPAGATIRASSASAFDLDLGVAAPKPAPAARPAAAVAAPAPAAPAAAPQHAPVSVNEPSDSLGRRKITDAGEALRALEESAAARKKGEAPEHHAAPPAPASPSSARRAMEDLGLTTAIPSPSVRPAPAPMSSRPSTPVVPPPAAPPGPSGELTMAFDHLRSAPPPPSAPPVRPPAPASVEAPAPRPAPVAAGAPPDLAVGGSTPMAPPAGFVPRGKAGRGDDQQRAVEDAKRLARLLVSEIKLYNERKVEEGRGNGDLYQRLKDDIERSRQVYEERTPEGVRTGTNFFHDELVRILGEGRAEILGPMG